VAHILNKKDPKSPATTSAAWDLMINKWDMVHNLLGGTSVMRGEATRYMPRHEEESQLNYEERLASTTLFNMFELTLDALVGRPFSDPVKLNDDVPSDIKVLTEDIDLQGNDLSVFSRKVFREGVGKGLVHILIDMPVITEEERGKRTKDDDNKEGRRPYWVMVRPENLIFASSQNINGQEVLTHVRIREVITEMNGFSEEDTEQIRVLEPGKFAVWRKIKSKKKKEEWKVVDSGATSLSVIPLVSFYSNEEKGLMLTKPPLEDLAHLNVRHWQSTSDQTNILTVARFPMLAVAGATDTSGATMAIGPKQLLGTKDPQGRFYYVEHTGRSIEAGRQDLLDLEEMMASYGAEFLKRRPGNATATARALDSAEATSPLQDMTVRFMDAIDRALDITAQWLGQEEGGTVEITTDFGPERINEAHVGALLALRESRDLSAKHMLLELQRMGGLADDFDFEANLAELASEPVLLVTPTLKKPTSDED